MPWPLRNGTPARRVGAAMPLARANARALASNVVPHARPAPAAAWQRLPGEINTYRTRQLLVRPFPGAPPTYTRLGEAGCGVQEVAGETSGQWAGPRRRGPG